MVSKVRKWSWKYFSTVRQNKHNDFIPRLHCMYVAAILPPLHKVLHKNNLSESINFRKHLHLQKVQKHKKATYFSTVGCNQALSPTCSGHWNVRLPRK